jgi:hypothetical protein
MEGANECERLFTTVIVTSPQRQPIIAVSMKRGAQVAFALSVVLFCLFLLGITDFGQTVLRGRIPPNADHWQLDDIAMGAGLAPWVYGLVPSVLLAFIGSVLLLCDRLKRRSWR